MTYLLSDLHGHYEQWQTLLRQMAPKESDNIFVLGDVLDRGPEPIKLLLDLMARSNVFCLLGNHEYIFLQCMAKLPPEATIDNFMQYFQEENFVDLMLWLQDGGRTTCEQYLALAPEEKEAVLEYLFDLPLYEELCIDGKDYLLTHSGLQNFRAERPLDDYAATDFLFDRPQKDSVYYRDKMLICGHTPTFHYPNHPAGQILQTDTFIILDGGCAFPEAGGQLTYLRLPPVATGGRSFANFGLADGKAAAAHSC